MQRCHAMLQRRIKPVTLSNESFLATQTLVTAASHTHFVLAKSSGFNLCVLFISQNSQQRVAYLGFRLRLRFYICETICDASRNNVSPFFVLQLICFGPRSFIQKRKKNTLNFVFFFSRFSLVWFNV